MTTHTDFAAPFDRPFPCASIAFVSVPGLPDVMRPAGPVAEGDRTLHPAIPLSLVEHRPADVPLPGMVPAIPYEPHRPLQGLPGPSPLNLVPPPDLDADLVSAQFSIVSRSRGRRDRARDYVGRLAAHAAEIRDRLGAAADRRVAVAIGTAELDAAGAGPLRGELIEVERQHRQAVTILADIEAEHARNEADLTVLCTRDESEDAYARLKEADASARAKLRKAHAARDLAQAAADDAKAVLDRATTHVGAVEDRLAKTQAEEAAYDAKAAERVRAALARGDAPPPAAEPFFRGSLALEDDLRAAQTAVAGFLAEHAGRVAALSSARLAVLAAVDEVMIVEAESTARDLEIADSRVMLLRLRLYTFTSRRPGDYVVPPEPPVVKLPNGMFERKQTSFTMPHIRQTAEIDRVMRAGPLPPHQGPFTANWTMEADGWTRFAAALADNPAANPAFAVAPLIPPPPPLPFSGAA